MHRRRRGFLAVAAGAIAGLAGCTDSDPDGSGTDGPGDAATTDGATAADGVATTTGGDDAATDATGTTTATDATGTTTGSATESTPETTAATTRTTRAPSVDVLNLTSNQGAYEPGDVEREAVDEVERGDRVALAARYRITVHDGSVSARFVTTIDDPEGFTAEYPPVDRGRDGLPSGYNEYEFHREFATDEFRAGEYTATLEVVDRIADLSTTATTTFTVTE